MHRATLYPSHTWHDAVYPPLLSTNIAAFAAGNKNASLFWLYSFTSCLDSKHTGIQETDPRTHKADNLLKVVCGWFLGYFLQRLARRTKEQDNTMQIWRASMKFLYTKWTSLCILVNSYTLRKMSHFWSQSKIHLQHIPVTSHANRRFSCFLHSPLLNRGVKECLYIVPQVSHGQSAT